MKITSAEYLTSSVSLDACPETGLPEFAVIGRSNVGKSSLINFLVNRNDLARVSATPGHTQMINFFTINRAWHLVDLPGYGYAKAPKHQRAKFSGMISAYLTGRDSLRGTLVLIDSSLPPQQIDLDFTRWLIAEGVPFVLVFTKTDKATATRVQKNIQEFSTRMSEFCVNSPMIFTVSARKKTGNVEILRFISEVMSKE
jgi:GTP-binding protein